MRWFLGLLLVVALVAGAAYGAGRFLLPNSLEVSRSVTIERPRASVFAMANDLRIAREWSPYYARDPGAEYAFSGEDPGAGQSMRWVSSMRAVGNGRISIVDSVPHEQIETIIELSDRATLDGLFTLRATRAGTQVTWTVTAECAEGWTNVPCRYWSHIARSTIGRDLEAGLNRLKTLAEQLPAVDFEGYHIEQVTAEPQDVLFVDVSIATAQPNYHDRATAEADGVAALNNASANAGIERPDVLVRVFNENDGGPVRFSVGYPYTGAAPARLVGARTGRTPGGAVLRLEFNGPRSQLPLMYQRIDAYMQAHRISGRPGAERWEVVRQVGAGQDPLDPIEQVEIFYPIE